MHQRLGIGELHLHQPAGQRTSRSSRQRRVPTDETIRLVPGDGKTEPGLEDVVGVVDVMAVVAVPLLHPQATKCLQPDKTRTGPCRGEPVEHMYRLVSRYVQLKAEFTDIGDPHAQNSGKAKVDLACGAERKRLVGKVGRGQRLE